ncbi:hypothetical protein [Vibrio sp. S12_S33]|uniref:hypothetical protein n=1 Tax=Vibrio sp. S12_S33 TaxID=2720223 RepID=UPI00177F36E1|nr:hypothetical protein [Vibrio sp. S12_S33]MBD1566333.1 hypothetical protein [Vibrio sp. S12_S33]
MRYLFMSLNWFVVTLCIDVLSLLALSHTKVNRVIEFVPSLRNQIATVALYLQQVDVVSAQVQIVFV